MSLPRRPPIPVAALQLFCLAPIPVGLRRGHIDTFEIATLHKSKIFDEIHCVADDQVQQRKWIAAFKRMGVPIFDLSDGNSCYDTYL
jgi:hypothetical protein